MLVRDLVSNQYLSGATVNLYEAYDQENLCSAGDNSKLIYTGLSNNQGKIDLDFVYSDLPATRYTVEVSLNNYSINCRTFTLNENRFFLDVGLSPKLDQHQMRFALEWGSDSALE